MAAGSPRPPGPRRPQRLAVVETPLYDAVVSSEGAKLQAFVLKYRGEKPMVIVGDLGPAGLLISADASRPPDVVPMAFSTERIAVGAERPTQDLVLTGELDGLRVRQRLTFRADDFAIDVSLRVENVTRTPRTITLALPWLTREAWHATPEKFQGQHPTEIVWSPNGHVERVEDLTAVGERISDGEWIALGSVWYVEALIPQTPGFKLVATSEGKLPEAKNGDKAPAGRASIALRATPTIPPGQAWEGGALIYAGPKEYERLRAHGLQETINFGGFPLPRRWGGLPMEIGRAACRERVEGYVGDGRIGPQLLGQPGRPLRGLRCDLMSGHDDGVFLQAGDGIRGVAVTGVQTCALPICRARRGRVARSSTPGRRSTSGSGRTGSRRRSTSAASRCRAAGAACRWRSEERRVGKEWRAMWETAGSGRSCLVNPDDRCAVCDVIS